MNWWMIQLLWTRILWRHWCRSPGSTLILILTLATGVGVFFSIRLANRAAVSGFEMFAKNLTGENDLMITAPSGRLDTRLLPRLREATGDLPVLFFPVLESTATLPEESSSDGFFGRQFQVVGLDLPTLANLIYLTDEDYVPPGGLQASMEAGGEHQRMPGAYITQRESSEFGWHEGDVIELIWNTQPRSLRIAGILPDEQLRVRAPDDLLLMDITSVQALSGLPNAVDRIEVKVPPGSFRDQWLADVHDALGSGSDGRWLVQEPDSLNQAGDTMTQAFRLNLTVLSCLALLVGIYLILQALEAAVTRRRSEIATLRSLGVEPRHIRAAWLIESFLLGLMGSLLGLGLGFVGAQFAVRGIASTINALYFSNTVEAAGWNHAEAGFALAAGLLASLAAGWIPARDAASTPPAQLLQRGVRGGGMALLRNRILGWGLLVAGAAAVLLPPLGLKGQTSFPLGGYTAALCLLVGASILVGSLFRPLGGKKDGTNALFTFARSQFRRPTGRHRLAAAGLLAAFSMASGMSILLASFETTMQHWISNALKADLYIAPRGIGNISNANRIEPEVWQAIASDPDASNAELGQMYPITFREARTYLVGAEGSSSMGWENLLWLEEPEDKDLARETSVTPAWVNESFMQRFKTRPGESIEVSTPSGAKTLRIEGVFADYGNEMGSILIDRRRLAQWYHDDRILNIALHMTPGVDARKVRERLKAAHPGLVIRLNQELREEVLRIFHQTFSITHALKWIGISVAVAGMTLALISLCVERRREYATLRELGMSRAGIAGSVALEGGLLAATGTLGGALLSVALGWILIYVINKQSFGWTLAFRIPWLEILLTATLITGISSFAAWRVGRWAGRLKAEREE